MAWIVFELDGTLVDEVEGMGPQPVDGAPEALMQLAAEGHRLTVHTSRFAPMPEQNRELLKTQIEEELQQLGFPPVEVWTGTTKPDADAFIGPKSITFDGDWPLALAQLQVMLEDAGLVPGLVPDDGSMEGLEAEPEQAVEQPEEEEPVK